MPRERKFCSMPQFRQRYDGAFLAALAVGTGVFVGLGQALLRALRSFEVQQLVLAVRARCADALGSLFAGMSIQLLLALSIPTALGVLFIGSFLGQTLATNRLRRSLAGVAAGTEPTPLRRLRGLLRLDAESLVVVDSPWRLCFCAGFLRPTIYLSTATIGQLQAGELGAVLAHEDHHRRRRDPLRMALLAALQQALFFLPVVRLLRQRYTVAQEVAADTAALQQPGGRAALARALYRLSGSAVPRGAAAAFAQHGSVSTRVAVLAGERFSSAPLPFAQILATAAVMTLGAFFLTPPASARVSVPVHCPTGSGATVTPPGQQMFSPLSQSPETQTYVLGGSDQRACHQATC